MTTPLTDTVIARRYSVSSLENKAENKLVLQKTLGWVPERHIPILCLPSGMTEGLGGETFKVLLPGLLTLQIAIVIRGKGSQMYGSLFTTLVQQQNHRIAILADEDTTMRKMYAAADMALFLTNPSTSPELLQCLRYGTVPIAPNASTLENYDPVQERGDAFLYEEGHHQWGCFAALVRALETYRLPFDWRTIQRHCMEYEEGQMR